MPQVREYSVTQSLIFIVFAAILTFAHVTTKNLRGDDGPGEPRPEGPRPPKAYDSLSAPETELNPQAEADRTKIIPEFNEKVLLEPNISASTPSAAKPEENEINNVENFKDETKHDHADHTADHTGYNADHAGHNTDHAGHTSDHAGHTADHAGHTEGKILVVALGGGEEELFASQASLLFTQDGHDVTVLLFGQRREDYFPPSAKLIVIPDDENSSVLTTEDFNENEWTSSSVINSRLRACSRMQEVRPALESLQVKVIVSPLFLHDVCVLALAEKLQVPVVGVLTSRVGAWWTLSQLGSPPSLSTHGVHFSQMPPSAGMWSRALNIAAHFNYLSHFYRVWQSRALEALPQYLRTNVPLRTLHHRVTRLLYTWDPLIDVQMKSTTFAIPIGGFTSTFIGNMKKDVLVPTLLNRAGIVVVSAGTRDAFVGRLGVQVLFEVLEKKTFTVLWKSIHSKLKPNLDHSNNTDKFIFKDSLPLNDILSHPRHRLLISTCGEQDVMAAIHYGSPLLCLPITKDQILCSEELRKLGMAKVLLASQINKENLQRSLTEVTSQRSYRLQARQLAEELHDQSTTPAERFIFHVENVMRRPHSKRFVSRGASLPLWQEGNADVFIALFLLIFCVLVMGSFCAYKFYPILMTNIKQKNA